MKAPKVFTGWVTSDGKAHDSQEDAQRHALREALLSTLYKNCRPSHGWLDLTPEVAVQALLMEYVITPKKVVEW